jgi:tryptophan-rich hypothetical protein
VSFVCPDEANCDAGEAVTKRNHPIHPTHLERSKWSSVSDDYPFKHWEVMSFAKKSGQLTLFAILEKATTIQIPWRELRDREKWEPGWK